MSRPHYRRRRAFTMVEILVAISVIIILVGMLFLGASHLVSGGKEKATRVTLTALKGMLAEYDSKTRLAKSPPFWLWHDTTTSARRVTSTTDFWKVPGRDPLSTPTPPALPDPMPLDAPGLVSRGNFNDTDMSGTSQEEITRNGSRQVLNTQLAMGLILQMPLNREALTKLPPESYFAPRWVSGNLPTPGSDGVLTAADLTTESVHYVQGSKVKAGTGGFLCINNTTGMVAASSTPNAGTDWIEDRSPATPILLDAWDNPIIFVPGTGLRLRLLNGAPDYNDLKCITAIIMSPEGKVDSTTNVNVPRILQVGRPFFASAGPDGDFAKGDDNIYSFE